MKLINKSSHNLTHNIVELCDCELGKEYITVEYINETIKQKDKFFTRVIINNNEEVIGFRLSMLYNKEELKDIIRVELYKLTNTLSNDEKIGLIKVIVVKEDYKRRGIGTALVKDAIDILNTKGSRIICSIGWKSVVGVNIG